MLQKRLEEYDEAKGINVEFKAALVQAITPFFADLMVDQFGNYLSQKIFEVSTHEEIVLITEVIKPCLVDISMNVHGTRAVQTLVEVLSKNISQADGILTSVI
jgi:hypothetical protein